MKWVLVVGLLVFLVACAPTGPTCSDPYIPMGNTCCLDRDANGICDVDENSSVMDAGELDCSLCAPEFVTQMEEVIVYRYICPDDRVVENRDECGEIIRSNADEFELNKRQDYNIIREFDTRATCRGQFRTAEVHLALHTTANEAILQVKSTPTGGFDDLLDLNRADDQFEDEYYYVGFCSSAGCDLITDAQLPSDTAHVLRVKLRVNDETVYTRDRLVDPTPEGEYGKTKC